MTRPTPPTSSLPPIARLSRYSTEDISSAIENLRTIYSASTLPHLPTPAKFRTKHLIHDNSVPDSGYASAEEDEDEDDAGDDEDFDLDALRSDTFERDFTVRWLTAFAARSDAWVSDDPSEEEARAALVDAAASILASFSDEDEDDSEAEDGLTRTFEFACPASVNAARNIKVVLNDRPLSKTDHTSVGLQSWASAIIFSERMCAAPETFGLVTGATGKLRILELGAGTGLLSLVAAKIYEQNPCAAEIVATDFHPSVLANLQTNVATNFPTTRDTAVLVRPLDWQTPQYDDPLDKPFEIILAADVVYHPEHARWIKGCVERLLLRPSDAHPQGGVFWLIIAVRPTGRHEGLASGVEDVFPTAAAVQSADVENREKELAILSAEGINRHNGIGRADESGYRLFRIGWA